MTAVAYDQPSLYLEPDMPVAAWVEIGKRITTTHRYSPWLIGDWALAGEHRYGPQALMHIDVTGLDPGDIADCIHVATAFPPHRRRRTLSFSHHRTVAKLPIGTQDDLLDTAQREAWTVAELTKVVRRLKAGNQTLLPDTTTIALRITVPDHQASAARTWLQMITDNIITELADQGITVESHKIT